MSRIRIIMFSLLAVLATSAVASASASAAEACHNSGGKEIVLCVDELEIGSPTGQAPVPFTSQSVGNSTLAVTGLGNIICKKATNTGQFDEKDGNITDSGAVEVSDLEIKFTECALEGKPACKVANITVNGGGDNLDGVINAALTEVAFSPSEGTLFTTIKITECGLLNGNYNVTGKQTCTLPESQSSKIKHTVKCAPAGSELKFGEKAATFTATEELEIHTDPNDANPLTDTKDPFSLSES